MTKQGNSVEWIKKQNILAFPYSWQRPAKTEEWVYEQCLNHFPESTFLQIVCFPWATLIDLLRSNKKHKAKPYLDALVLTSPKTTLIRATVCQHIYALDMLEWFQRLGITDLYWPHAVKNVREIAGIVIHPFPLYPVRCFDNSVTDSNGGKLLSHKRYLYSFIGAYEANLYLSPVRRWILDLPLRPDALVTGRDEWHYEKQVYHQQIGGIEITNEEQKSHYQRSEEYSRVMTDSLFCLCPSGSGPNSIRLWEALGFGCIPVILSDDLLLPGHKSDWDKATIQVKETKTAVSQLPLLLEDLAGQPQRLEEMREAGQELWRMYGEQGPITILSELAQSEFISERFNPSSINQS